MHSGRAAADTASLQSLAQPPCREFVPALLDIVGIDATVAKASAESNATVAALRANMQEFLLYGIPKSELEGIMTMLFRTADTDGSGQLDKHVRTLVLWPVLSC